ncbi:retrovirus-related pol polyprotein from transposon TNT 1-94 [Tanacetum coccineum]
MKNKVEAQHRKVNKKNSVVEPIRHVDVNFSLLNANSEPICATCHVFTEVGLKWKPTGRTFTIVGNSCPLTRITSANVVPPKKTTSHSVETQNPKLKVYNRKPKMLKMLSRLFSGTVRFENDNIARIIGRILENTCFIRNLEGVDLLSGSRDTNLYTISLDDILKTSPICLLSKASKTKSWLWHHYLSYLNFGTLNNLAKDGLARGIPRLKFHKDHLCSACSLGKIKKSSHQPKAEDTNQEKLYLLHMDLCGPMRVASINGKRYILVIVDDYSRFTWVKFLRTKYEAPEAIIKCIKNIQVRLNATVHNVRTDNGTKFVNQTLHEFYENVDISHQTSVVRTPQHNGAEAINSACYTQNRSIIRRRYNKTSYELMQDKKPDLSLFHVFGPLCYPTNDNDDLVQEAAALRAVDLADSPGSTSIDQDAPSSSTPSTQEQEQSLNISQGFEDSPKTPIFRDDPLNESPHEESPSQGSSSNQLQTDVMWCYFDAFLTFVEPKNFKQAMTEPIYGAICNARKTFMKFDRLQFGEIGLSCPDNVQEEGIDFEESFAPLLLIEAIVSSSKCPHKNMDIYYMDVKLGVLEWRVSKKRSTVYQQKRFVDRSNPSDVYKLKKALYGLKQAPRAWNDMLSSFLISQYFSKGAVDQTLFTREAGSDLLLVQIFVDDIIVASTNTVMCNEFANQMTTKFKMSMMGQMSFLLGLQISQSPRGIFINQSKYASEIVKKYGLLTTDSIDTPLSAYVLAYADADHAGCQDTSRSTSGSAQFLGDKLVSWSSKKQKCTTISSTEAEYIVLSGCCAQILWMRSQLTDYGFHFNKIPLYCDNKSEIALCCNNVQHSRAKHIDVRYHFIKEQVENGIVQLYFVRTEYQMADIFTKPLPRERFNFLIEKLGMRSMSLEMLKRLAEETDE